jgi:choloylglycine hydrolase
MIHRPPELKVRGSAPTFPFLSGFRRKDQRPLAGAFLAGLFFFFTCSHAAVACSRVLSNDNGRVVLVGQTLDLFRDPGTNIWIFPKGVKRNGLTSRNPLTWVSKYGSLVLPVFDIVTSSGFNEKGFAVNLLHLRSADFGDRDDSIPGLSISLWGQFFLDNFATVAEALQYVRSNPMQVQLFVTPDGQTGGGHLALADAGGDSGIIEYIGGKLHILHDRGMKVMTNDPTIDKQLEHMKQYRGFGGIRALPGSNSSPAHRFVRAASFLAELPKPETDEEAATGLFIVLRNISVKIKEGDPSRRRLSFGTHWRAVADLTRRVLYFESAHGSTVIRVRFDHFDVQENAPVMKLDLVNTEYRDGDVSGMFKPSKPFEFRKAASPEELKKAERI